MVVLRGFVWLDYTFAKQANRKLEDALAGATKQAESLKDNMVGVLAALLGRVCFDSCPADGTAV